MEKNLQLNKEQNNALELALQGTNLFVTGGAGVGKTVLVRWIVDELQRAGKEVIVCAPTGIAAIQVGGVTIHRAFQARTVPYIEGDRGRLLDTVKVADVIVIDEISMCRFDLLEYVARCIMRAEKVAKKKIQIIVAGDFYQLPPVVQTKDEYVLCKGWPRMDMDNGYYAFAGPSWQDLHLSNIELTQIMRQTDQEFAQYLNRIRKGDVAAIDWINEHASRNAQPGIYIYPTNRLVEQKNRAEIDKLGDPTRTYRADIINYSDKYPADEVLKICEGARVMTLINNSQDGYQNGSLGTVCQLGNSYIKIRLDSGKTVDIERCEWDCYEYVVVDGAGDKPPHLDRRKVGSFRQYPLRVAYAVTVHKSQGQTFDSVNLDPYCFAAGQLYVALSRVRDISHLHLLRDIRPSDLIVSPEVAEFYRHRHRAA